MAARATSADTRDGEMVTPAVIIERTFSGFSRGVIGSRPLPDAHSSRGWRTRGRSHGCASGDEEECDTREGGIDEVDFHDSDWLYRVGLIVRRDFVRILSIYFLSAELRIFPRRQGNAYRTLGLSRDRT